MDYFINQTIHFDSVNGLLYITGNADSSVHLSRPGSRLLTELIIHCGNTMTREDLLKSVWENHGLRPSGSNLSNHISQLRKIFCQLGMNQNIIVTVPKKGFRFEAEVTLLEASNPEKTNHPNNTNKSNLFTACKKSYGHSIYPLLLKKHFYFTIIITFIVVLISLSSYSFHSKNSEIAILNACQIIDLAKDKKLNREEKLKSLSFLIKQKKINCQKNNSIIYFRFTNAFPRRNYDKNSVFLSQCYPTKKNRITHCESYLLSTLKKP